jgi:hypothetical protein
MLRRDPTTVGIGPLPGLRKAWVTNFIRRLAFRPNLLCFDMTWACSLSAEDLSVAVLVSFLGMTNINHLQD